MGGCQSHVQRGKSVRFFFFQFPFSIGLWDFLFACMRKQELPFYFLECLSNSFVRSRGSNDKKKISQGTRKRLVSSITSASSANVSSPESVAATPAPEQSNGPGNHMNNKSHASDNSTTKNAQKYKHSPSYIENERSPKRFKDSAGGEKQSQPLSPPLMQAAVVAAVAAAANAGHQYPVRPVNVHSTKLTSNCSRLMNTPSLCSNPIPRNVNALSSDLAVS